jgi:PIN domain nuclease of toxin-antitoxin system
VSTSKTDEARSGNLAKVANHHADPFDRMLIAQARAEGLTIATANARFGEYDVTLL